MYDVIVIGAGPVGCKVGEISGKEGLQILILEEHSETGLPVHCTGLVSHRIFDLSGVSKDVIVNTVKKARFYASNKNSLELKSKKPAYVIDRERFDRELSERAKDSGVEIKTSTKFKGYKKGGETLEVNTNHGNFRTKILVGADGPSSTVAHAAGIKLPDSILTAVQTTVKSDFDSDVVELWFGPEISPDFFGWVVPENKSWGRFGLASSKKTVNYFKNFMMVRFKNLIDSKNNLAGVIRYGLIESSVSDNVILVGDAASQVKPFSGGGLIYGLIGANFAAEACIKALEEEEYDSKFLKKNYDEAWKEKLAWPIRKGLIMSRLIHSFSVDQLDFLFSSISKGKLTKLLEITDMDLL